jgi:hypothetical protein
MQIYHFFLLVHYTLLPCSLACLLAYEKCRQMENEKKKLLNEKAFRIIADVWLWFRFITFIFQNKNNLKIKIIPNCLRRKFTPCDCFRKMEIIFWKYQAIAEERSYELEFYSIFHPHSLTHTHTHTQFCSQYSQEWKRK